MQMRVVHRQAQMSFFWRCIDENIMDEEAFCSTSMMNTCFGKGCGDSVYVDDIDKQDDLW